MGYDRVIQWLQRFVAPMNKIMEPAVHCGMVGATVRKKIFTDLGYADNVSLLAEMVEVLLLLLSQAMSQRSYDQVLSMATTNELEVVEYPLRTSIAIQCPVAQTNRRSNK